MVALDIVAGLALNTALPARPDAYPLQLPTDDPSVEPQTDQSQHFRMQEVACTKGTFLLLGCCRVGRVVHLAANPL